MIKELENPIYLKLEHRGNVYYHVGERKDINDDFDINTPYDEDIPQCIKDSCGFDSVLLLTKNQFLREMQRVADSNIKPVFI
ncbi:hypothetical protein [Phocaeicola faecium]|uniref:Uncharacterized protein n=1 Tax=Phocaeicola faecium TaxID=2762213 RepID=A0ABR8VAP7_9BACT|nr:hypothetical protein [Phocaeicola faecium]MBD8001868.1 hypothetical protein [Phocaeicola faecium]